MNSFKGKKLLKVSTSVLSLGLLLSCSSLEKVVKVESLSLGDTTALLLSKYQGYTLRFKDISNVTKYVVYDDNDYRSEGLTIYPSEKDSSGYLYYTTEVVGKHNVYVKAYTTTGVVKSNTVTATENLPVFDYSPFAPVYFYNVLDLSDTSATYTIIKNDGTLKTVTQSEFNSTYIYNQNDIIDFTTTSIENYKINTLLSDMKARGCNVVNLGNRFSSIETGSQWWWGGSFENSVCKRIMDAAWNLGMKCIVSDFSVLSNSERDNGASTATSRITSAEFKKAAQHPAFYGIELNDEPLTTTQSEQTRSEIENTCLTVHAILNAWHDDATLSKLPEPFIHTDLASYNMNNDGLWPNGVSDFKNYLLSWITGTGLDYLCFDFYTYSTYQYGNKKILGSTRYFDPSKSIYDCINEIKATYPNVKFHQTLTRSNDKSRNSVTYKDVYSSTFLAVSQGNFGYSNFTNTLGASSSRNACLDSSYNKTNTYTWALGANEQYVKLVNLLDGYSLASNSITNYKYSTSYGYGDALRTSTSSFVNSDGDYCKFVANFGTVGSETESVKVDSGKTYYLFGKDKTFNALTGTGSNVTINEGEAILIINDNISPVNEVAKTVELGFKISYNGSTPIPNSDSFAVKIAVDNNYLKRGLGEYDSYGIYVSTNSKTHYFDKADCKLENDDAVLYVVINLGSAVTNNRCDDLFTVKVAAVSGTNYTYSSDNNIQFSIKTLVKDLYDDPITRPNVSTLYSYLYQ